MAARMVKTVFDFVNHTITSTYPGTDLEPLVLHLDKMSGKTREYAAYHGCNQKTQDAAADAKTPAQKRAASAEVIAHLESGSDDWNRKAIHAPKVLDVGLVAQAIANLYTKGNMDAANRLIATTQTKRSVDRTAAAQEWADTPEIGGEMDKILRARKPAVKSAADMLAEIEAASTGDEGETPANLG